MRDALVFIGRFQPFHNGHKAVIEAALEQAKEVVVVVGSSFAARNIRNPFTFEERKAMIKAVFPSDNVLVVPVSDFPYDDNKWVNAIQKIVDETIPDAKDVGLIGHSKDSTSYYLNIFPRWKNHVEVEDVGGINATDIRNSIFGTHLNKEFVELGLVRFALDTALNEKLPAETVKVLKKIVYSGKLDHDSAESGLYINEKTAPFKVLQSEYEMVKKYKEAWKAAPFPPTFMTVDAVVVQSGHLLLVKRGDMPGKGLWALPGGFLEQKIGRAS
jgi:bifunctional NMN adenylyltransferase/nudix hydrolase